MCVWAWRELLRDWSSQQFLLMDVVMSTHSESLQNQESYPSTGVDASNLSSPENNSPGDTVIVEKCETPNASKPSKRLKIEAPLSENAPQQDRTIRPDSKNVRGRRGLLKQMAEMPLDTLHEIFLELEPADLLHLSWASKSLNTILMEKPSRYIWEEVGQFNHRVIPSAMLNTTIEQAFERLYESDNPPPSCPEDVNLAQYARFLFSNKCSVCCQVLRLLPSTKSLIDNSCAVLLKGTGPRG